MKSIRAPNADGSGIEAVDVACDGRVCLDFGVVRTGRFIERGEEALGDRVDAPMSND
jgi:hypothetical protein